MQHKRKRLMEKNKNNFGKITKQTRLVKNHLHIATAKSETGKTFPRRSKQTTFF